MSKFSVILFFSIILYIKSGVSKEKVVVAINCGGSDFTDSNGVKYSSDKYFDKGTVSDHGLNYEIKGTKDEELYQTERWSSSTLTYSLPIKQDGKYVLVLKFSEVFFNNKGEKIFDFAIGDKKILKNIDIFAKVGKATAYDEFIQFEVKENIVYYNGIKINNAIDDNDKLLIKFMKGKADNPKINAILLIRGSMNDAGYQDYQKTVSDFNKKKFGEEKKQYILDLRHDSDEIYDEKDLMDDNFEFNNLTKSTGVLSAFGTSLGSMIMASIIGFLVMNYLIDLF